MPKYVPRVRKHKVRRRLEENGNSRGKGPSAPDPNAHEILPSTRAEKDFQRQAVKDVLRAEQPKMSGRKQKRLDKYIVCGKIYVPKKD